MQKIPTIPARSVRSRVTGAMAAVIEEASEKTGESVSAIIRAALVVELAKRGLWPPRHDGVATK